ncbi:MAG: hypothetical protein KGH72_04800 [Candidatus Micrarchaeota archaeon]|nr:hypothetical protein [Candidatus Micrarchaeota archaeon]
MASATRIAVQRQAVELTINREPVDMPTAVTYITGRGIAFASLSQARVIQKSGREFWVDTSSRGDCYWIGAQNERVSRDTYAGVPPLSGYFIDNKNGTFTRLDLDKLTEAPRYENLLFVSEHAAAKVSMGEGPLVLEVGSGFICGPLNGARLAVVRRDSHLAMVAFVPHAHADHVPVTQIRELEFLRRL